MSETLASACAVTAAAVAATVDVRTGRVPNVLVLVTAVTGFVLASAGWSGASTAAAAAGLVLGGALMLPGHLAGATGAGDVKLLAALGALVGPKQIALAWLCSAIGAGLLACGVAMRRGRLKDTLIGTARLIARRPDAEREIRAADHNRYALGPAILVGTLIALFGSAFGP